MDEGLQPSPPGFQSVDRPAASLPAESRRRGGGAQAPDVFTERPVQNEERGAAFSGRQDIQESDAREEGVPALRREREGEPGAQLSSPGGGHPVEVAARASPGPKDFQVHVPGPPQPGEGGINLGEIGSPDVIEILAQGAREIVAGPRFLGKKTQEDVGKRHGETISK